MITAIFVKVGITERISWAQTQIVPWLLGGHNATNENAVLMLKWNDSWGSLGIRRWYGMSSRNRRKCVCILCGWMCMLDHIMHGLTLYIKHLMTDGQTDMWTEKQAGAWVWVDECTRWVALRDCVDMTYRDKVVILGQGTAVGITWYRHAEK